MASQNPLDLPGGLVASEDLSTKQFYFGKIDGDYSVALCDTDGELPIGVIQNKPGSGEAVTIECTGVSKVVAGEALTAGDLVGTDANGKGRKVEATATGADTGDWAIGICVQGAGLNELASVKLGISHLVTA